MLATKKSQPLIIPSVSPTSLLEPSLFPTGSSTDPGFPENDPPTAPPLPPTTSIYIDPKFGFSIPYPETDFIKETNASTIAPSPVHQVLFYDKASARSETAELQPPTCGIYVYANKDHLPVLQWIAKNKPHGGSTKQVAIGNTQGYKVELSTMIYPGEFYYIEKEIIFMSSSIVGMRC